MKDKELQVVEPPEAPILHEGPGQPTERAEIPYNISNSHGYGIRKGLLFKMERWMVEQSGWFLMDAPDDDYSNDRLDSREKTCLQYWHTIRFIDIKPVEEASHWESPRKGMTHRLSLSPEAWDLCHRVRWLHDGQRMIPSVKCQDDIEVVKSSRGRYTRKHPSYGSITVYRGNGAIGALYGSDMKHDSCITLDISASDVTRDLNRNYFHSGRSKIEVRMSESQWAALLCSLNQGDGTPCTITWDEKHGTLPKCPWTPEVMDFRQELDEGVEAVSDYLSEALALCEKLSNAKGSIKKGEFRDMYSELISASRKLNDSLPFLKTSFEEAMAKTVEVAAREIQAKLQILQAQVGNEGIKKLKALGVAEAPISGLLEASSEEKVCKHPFGENVVLGGKHIWRCIECKVRLDVDNSASDPEFEDKK